MPVGYKVDTVGAGRLTPVPPPCRGALRKLGRKFTKCTVQLLNLPNYYASRNWWYLAYLRVGPRHILRWRQESKQWVVYTCMQ